VVVATMVEVEQQQVQVVHHLYLDMLVLMQ